LIPRQLGAVEALTSIVKKNMDPQKKFLLLRDCKILTVRAQGVNDV